MNTYLANSTSRFVFIGDVLVFATWVALRFRHGKWTQLLRLGGASLLPSGFQLLITALLDGSRTFP